MKKSEFILKIENLWYHEKAKIIIFGVLIFFLVFCLVQCAENKEADVYILYAGPESLSKSEISLFSDNMEKFIPEDYNKDGSTVAEYTQFLFDGADDIAAQKNLDAEMYGGKSVILLLSPKQYKYCKKNAYIVPLKTALGEVPEIVNDEYYVKLFDLECASEMGVNKLPIDTVVCIAACRENSQSSLEYNRQIKFFKYMLTYGM